MIKLGTIEDIISIALSNVLSLINLIFILKYSIVVCSRFSIWDMFFFIILYVTKFGIFFYLLLEIEKIAQVCTYAIPNS